MEKVINQKCGCGGHCDQSKVHYQSKTKATILVQSFRIKFLVSLCGVSHPPLFLLSLDFDFFLSAAVVQSNCYGEGHKKILELSTVYFCHFPPQIQMVKDKNANG